MIYANGYDKDKVMAQIRKYNNGTRCLLDGTCCYLNDKGNRCFIGCFIPDNHIALRNSSGVTGLLERFPDLASYMPFESLELLQDFQLAHDNALNRLDIHEDALKFLDDLESKVV